MPHRTQLARNHLGLPFRIECNAEDGFAMVHKNCRTGSVRCEPSSRALSASTMILGVASHFGHLPIMVCSCVGRLETKLVRSHAPTTETKCSPNRVKPFGLNCKTHRTFARGQVCESPLAQRPTARTSAEVRLRERIMNCPSATRSRRCRDKRRDSPRPSPELRLLKGTDSKEVPYRAAQQFPVGNS